MDYRDIIKLKVFFSALKESGFKQNLNQIPSSITIGGQRTPVEKDDCLKLLRKFPQFQGDEFKDDNTIIKYLSDPRNKGYILDNFSQQQRIEMEKLLEAKVVATEVGQPSEQAQPATSEQPIGQTSGGESAGTMSDGSHFGIPSSGSQTSYGQPRGFYRPNPKPETPESKLYVANKSGVVTEERTITPTSSVTNKPEPSKLVDQKGKVFGEQPSTQPKLVLARSDGSIIKPAAPTPKIAITNSSGTVVKEHTIPSSRRFNLGRIKVPSSFKNFGSSSGIFFKKNSGRIAGGLGQVAGGVGRNIVGPGLSSVYNLGARAGIGGVNAFANLSNQVSGRVTSLKGFARPSGKLGGKFALAGFAAIFLFIFVSGIIGGITGTNSTTEASPVGPGNVGVGNPTPPPGFSGRTNLKFYCQADVKFQNSCFDAQSGCGPTSMAMVFSAFGSNLTPADIDKSFNSNNPPLIACGPDAASNMSTVITGGWLQNQGYTYEPLCAGPSGVGGCDENNFLKQAAEYTKPGNGWVIIASQKHWRCPKNCTQTMRDAHDNTIPVADHIFVIDNADVASRQLNTRDPLNCGWLNGDGGESTPGGFKRSVDEGDWLYGYAIKKVGT